MINKTVYKPSEFAVKLGIPLGSAFTSLSLCGKVASNASTAEMSSQQSAAVDGMYIHFLPSSAFGTSSQTRSDVRKLPSTTKLTFFFLQLTKPRLT